MCEARVRLITSQLNTEKQVRGEISYTAYRKLTSRLKDMDKEELWAVLRHDIFHRLNDGDVDELSKILDQMQKNGQSVSAATLERIVAQVTAAADYEDEENEKPLNLEHSRLGFVTDIPTDDDLNHRKDQLDVLYDATFFTNYVHPDIKQQTAQRLIDFTSAQKLPIQELWGEVAKGNNAIVTDEEHIL